MVTDRDVAGFRTFGYLVLRQALDAEALEQEVDRALDDAFPTPHEMAFGDIGAAGRYVPMMGERTPVSLELLDRFQDTAAVLLGAPVVPLRAKAVRYLGAATWHADSERALASLGFLAYLEPLRADTGALRVLPGSHHPAYAAALRAHAAAHGPAGEPGAREVWTAALPGQPVETVPGDVIVVDEHLWHASLGGRDRRQWRVDYFADPIGPDIKAEANTAAEAEARAYLADTYRPDWDGGYDVDRYPTYGPHWRASGRPAVARLRALGAEAQSAAEETHARAARAAREARAARAATDT
jgi:hypothetical protein